MKDNEDSLEIIISLDIHWLTKIFNIKITFFHQNLFYMGIGFSTNPTSTATSKNANINQEIQRLSLFHVTPVENAEQIIQSQHFIPGNGLYGRGVYFANTIEATTYKTQHHKDQNIQWTFLIADVYVGKWISFSKDQAKAGKIDVNLLKSQGYNSIIGYKMHSGRELVCLDENRIHNIKYVFGVRPNSFFYINRPRIVLFNAVSSKQAQNIHDNQSFKPIDGKFGKGIYLFYTITDALQQNPGAETYLACDARVSGIYKLRNGENLNSKNFKDKNFKCFMAKDDHQYYYIFTDPSLISSIHFCGGNPWN